MSAEHGPFDLAVVSLRDTEQEGDSRMRGNTDDHIYNMDFQTNISKEPDLNRSTFRYTNGTMNVGTSPDLTTTGELKLCSVHDLPLDRYCSTEGKLTCSVCVTQGSCKSHKVTQLVEQATTVRNQLVDICEKMQLQALRIERFIKHTLTTRERAVQVEASSARERVVAQVNSVREALEEEEQHLLEAVQREQERVEQCLLTQRAHWSKALDTLTQARTQLVHTLTHSTDAALMSSNQEISDRIEEAEGVGEPRDSQQLNMSSECSNSELMLGLWASAMLLAPSARGLADLHFDERTVSPLLSLSPDRRTLSFVPKRRGPAPPYDPARFDRWPNALCSQAVSSGTHAWLLEVGTSAAFKVGICYASMERKGSGNGARLGYNAKSWALSHYDGSFSFCHGGHIVAISMVKRPSRVGLLLDWSTHTLLFYDPDSNTMLHGIRQVFSEPLLLACAVADQSISIVH
ncbi:B box and SPRY domain-containing protein [Brachyhypopomus gauderio]|uniref:B box and SPRY domain-containing protein n=1 Tax=Brachyhypopomus gauderio TaxID=698409 RepID=UPI0040423F64